MTEYNNLQHKSVIFPQSQDKERRRILSFSKAPMGSLIQNDLLRDVYKDTK